MRKNTCCFIGHRECSNLSPEQVRAAIESLIRRGVTDFLCGGMGDFDWLCARETHSSNSAARTYDYAVRRHLLLCNLAIP